MWQRYSRNVSCANPAELDFKVGRQAFEAGIGQKEIALMLAVGSPTVKQMMGGQRKSQATKYVNQIARLCSQEQKRQTWLNANRNKQIQLGD